MSDSPDRFVDETGDIDSAAVGERITMLADRAARDAETFDPPESPPDPEQAIEYLRTGAGQVIVLYAHLRTGGRFYHFSPEEFEQLETAMNTWFSLYAACLGVEMESAVSLRTAAEAFVDTEDILAVAETVTGVSGRS